MNDLNTFYNKDFFVFSSKYCKSKRMEHLAIKEKLSKKRK